MEIVEPIRERKKIETIKKLLFLKSKRDYCLFVLGINSGLRISDLLNLKIHDVVDDNNLIRDRITIREKKTNKTKDFPLVSNSQTAIKEYLANRQYDLSDPLFLSKKQCYGKKPIQRDQAYKIINNVAKEIGINERIGTHTLRKTFGYHAYKAGTSIEYLQKLLNHSSQEITLRYIGITKEHLDDIYIKLNL